MKTEENGLGIIFVVVIFVVVVPATRVLYLALLPTLSQEHLVVRFYFNGRLRGTLRTRAGKRYRGPRERYQGYQPRRR